MSWPQESRKNTSLPRPRPLSVLFRTSGMWFSQPSKGNYKLSYPEKIICDIITANQIRLNMCHKQDVSLKAATSRTEFFISYIGECDKTSHKDKSQWFCEEKYSWSNVSWNKMSWLMFPAIKWANCSNICWRCIFRIAIISTPFESKCKESHKYFECWILLNLNIESYPFFAWRLLTDRGAVAEEYWKLRALEKRQKEKGNKKITTKKNKKK